ncbi:MAG: (Fe-S)-binding protein [Myxococcaceae bacterium]
MSSRSSTVTEQHRQAYANCSYCPKACRFACPVSEATHNETTSTWAKMTEAHLVTTGKREVEAGGARALYACTGCMRCRSFCNHQNEVGAALFSARQNAVDREVAPEGARSTLRTFDEHGNPFGRDLSQLVAQQRADTPVRYQLFTGCSSLVKRPDLIDDALEVAGALGMPVGVSKASARCCGYPLYAAGDLNEFEVHARRMAEALKPHPELLVLDPGCAYTLKVVYPRVGVELRTDVRTLYEALAESLDQAPAREPLWERVTYHDACHLGRGLGQYEAPRKLLRAAVREVKEPQETREDAGCSGGGGLLPRTMPDASVNIAKRQGERLVAEDEGIVTACPTSRRMFERAGRRADDLISVLRRWLHEGAPQ